MLQNRRFFIVLAVFAVFSLGIGYHAVDELWYKTPAKHVAENVVKPQTPPATTTPAVTTPPAVSKPIVTLPPEPVKATQTVNELQQALTDLNAYRVSSKVPALTLNDKLTKSAQMFAEYLATQDTISHKDGSGKNALNRATSAGYIPAKIDESISVGLDSFSNSLLILVNQPKNGSYARDKNVSDVGIGIFHNASSKYKHYYVIIYARSK